jgi:hypothetical protein
LGNIQVGSIYGADFVLGVAQQVLNRILESRWLGIHQIERVDQVIKKPFCRGSDGSERLLGSLEIFVPDIDLFDMMCDP